MREMYARAECEKGKSIHAVTKYKPTVEGRNGEQKHDYIDDFTSSLA